MVLPFGASSPGYPGTEAIILQLHSMFGRKAFSVVGLMAWNLLPTHSFDNFWCVLKTALYSARNARIASTVLATAIPSVHLSVCLSVRHTPVLCQNDGT